MALGLAACGGSKKASEPTGTPSIASPGSANNLTGTWTGTWSGTVSISGPLTLHLVHAGQQISGTLTFQSRPCVGGKLSSPFTLPLTGMLAGSAVTLTIGPTRATLTGSVNGTSMSGTWTPSFCPPGHGSWQVTKST